MSKTQSVFHAWILKLGVAGFTLLLVYPCTAANIAGKVMNRSGNQPSGGDVVVLYRVDPVMREAARTQSQGDGTFHFENREAFRYLLAAFHQGVSYHTKTLSGAASVEISVYDASALPKQLREESDTLFLQPDDDVLKVTEFFVLANSSNPPRTVSAKRTFDFVVPPGAILDSTAVQPPETLPLLTKVSACGPPRQYCIAYPMRPGITKIRAVYHLPYSGSVSMAATLLRPVGELALMVPDSIRLDARNEIFHKRAMRGGFSAYLASHMPSGKSLRFRLSASNRPVDLEIEAERSIQRFKSLQLSATAVPQTANSVEPVLRVTLSERERHLLSFTALWAVCFCAGLVMIASFKKRAFQKRACERNGGGSSP